MTDVATGAPLIERGETHAAYERYAHWKQWTGPFTFTPGDARYFRVETRGAAIRDADVLEIGFGSGAFLAWASSLGARVSGTEIIPSLVEEARRRDVTLLAPDFETVAHRLACRFDTIVAFDVFEHFTFDDVTARLDAAHAMLRPGGHLILRFPNGQSPFGLTKQHGDPTHLSVLSLGKLEPAIARRDWQVVRYRGQAIIVEGGVKRRAVRLLRSALRGLVSLTIRFVYAAPHPMDAVVVLVLRKGA